MERNCWLAVCGVLLSCVSGSQGELCTSDVCKFTLELRRERTMLYSQASVPLDLSYNVDLDGSDLKIQSNDWHLPSDPNIGQVVDMNDVKTADGFQRTIVTVNGMFPGPAIEVMHGAQVIVKVTNHMLLEATSIHWHGMHMINTPWMDGVAMLTQCPIMPGQSYEYRFRADPVGTHWYHSHVPGQRVDGLFGFLVVHEHLPRYETFNVFVNDWNHDDIITYDVDSAVSISHPGSGDEDVNDSLKHYMVDNTECGALKFHSCLIDGRGRYDASRPYPLREYTITKDQRYRMRLINSGMEFAFEISIDDHTFEVVAVDGSEISPITVDSFMLFAGETIDVEFVADQPINRYWMRSNILSSGIGPRPVPDGIEVGCKAVIKYEGAAPQGDPSTSPKSCTQQDGCTVFNCPFEYYLPSYYKTCIHVDEARSLRPQGELDKEYGLQDSDDDVVEYFINIGFGIGPNMNGRRNLELPTPIYGKDIAEHLIPCGPECISQGCLCVNTKSLPHNRTVQLVMSGLTPTFTQMAHHTLHLHGHNFAVLRMAHAPLDPATGFWTEENQDLTCNSENNVLCANPRWTTSQPALNKINPPVKDTIIIPARGYVVVRFRTENPGHWMLHCHQEMHVLEGMAMTFIEAVDQIKPLPKGFPTCGGFEWSDEDYAEYLADTTKGYTSPSMCEDNSSDTDDSNESDNDGNSEDDDDNLPRDGMLNPVVLEMTTAIGAAFGFLLCGGFIAIVPVILFVCCNCCGRKNELHKGENGGARF